jgi:hypothetical protein
MTYLGYLWLFLLMTVFVTPVQAAIVPAASCNAADVQSALNQATDGDTVSIPAGTCTWTTAVTWTAPSNVTVQGAGDTSMGGGDVTVIEDGYATNAPLWSITINASGTFRMTGLTLRHGTGGVFKTNEVLFLSGLGKQMRVDHSHFDSSGYTGSQRFIRVSGWINGVFDHNIFNTFQAIDVWYTSFPPADSAGDGAWAAPTGLGSSDFIFVEDNQFSWNTQYGAENDCSHGGKMVLRHNSIYWGGLQTHPTVGAGGRGCRALEIYENTFTGPDNPPNFNVLFISSGTGVFWHNSSLHGYTNFMTIHSMRGKGRASNGTYDEVPTPAGWGYCGAEYDGTWSNWDGNASAKSGYPCFDQPGRGQSDSLLNDFPNVINATTNTKPEVSAAAWARSALEPIYLWGNSHTPAPGWGGTYIANYDPTKLAANRDYYSEVSPFTGAGGTGEGLLSARPATCIPHVAYWATDTDTLYQCTSPSTWTAYYRPYRYPHPLTGGTAPIRPPSQLHVVQ